MNLQEYQSKEIFRRYGIPVPTGDVLRETGEVSQILAKLGGNQWVAKAQVHAGGRGKGGGVKLLQSESEVADFAAEMLGSQLITPQTDEHGLPVNELLIETPSDIREELYLGLLVDRAKRQVVIMCSAAGGMDIEAVAAETPEKIHTIHVLPETGFMPFQGRQLAFKLGLSGSQVREFVAITSALYQLFIENDASLVEVNPLIITADDSLMALDAKINLDGNALYRHADLQALRDIRQEDERERQASEHDLNYISLDGNIACMVNGAGLAMATMDLIKLHGGTPANFLDVGGGTTAERVSEAFKIILSNDNVEAILVNIFGGIVRCDLIAEGILQAMTAVKVEVPVVVRLEGTNVEQGRTMLAESSYDIINAEGLADAAKKVVAAVGGAQ